jgi:hypothetical protein
MHAERNPPTEPPCEGCLTPLAKENEAVARVYMAVRSQCRTRFNGEYDVVVDLDFVAVKVILDMYGIRNQKDVFHRIRAAFFHFLNKEKE